MMRNTRPDRRGLGLFQFLKKHFVLFAFEQFLKQDLGAWGRKGHVADYFSDFDAFCPPHWRAAARNPTRNTRPGSETRRGIHVIRRKKPDAKYTSRGQMMLSSEGLSALSPGQSHN
jgi:hypothetical protein